jgi:hypothetical protein
MDQQEHSGGSLYPAIDIDEPESPSRHENITPLAPMEQEVSLSTILAAIESLNTRVDDCQRQIQELNALFVRTNSPSNRSQSPIPMRRPSPVRETRFATAPPETQGHPRRTYEQEYTYTAPNLVRAGTAPPEPARFEREASITRRERQFSEIPTEIPPYRPPGDARATVQTPKTLHKPQTFDGTPLENFSSWIWKMESFLRSTRTPADEYFSTAIFYLTGDADSFAYELVRQNGGDSPS